MLNITNELKAKLLAAKSAEEVTELLKADGQEITPEDAARLWEEISRHRNQDGSELSPDELEAISGGVDRDWLTDGCAATVEPGSDCWGTDGGCSVHNIEYKHMPNGFCPDCGRPYCVNEINSSLIGLHRKTTWCYYCNSWSREEWWDGGKPVTWN